MIKQETIPIDEIKSELCEKDGCDVDMASFKNVLEVLQGSFVNKEEEYQKYSHVDIVSPNKIRYCVG